MNTTGTLAIAIALVTSLSGCIIQSDDSSVFQHISIHDGSIAVHAHSAPDAIVTAVGDLSIDGKAVAVTSGQRDLLKQYYARVMAIRSDGIATGKAGAAMAGHAIGAVASGLAHGNPDSIGPAIDAHASELENKAAAICVDLAALHASQGAVTAALPAFTPYASIDTAEVSHCESHHAG